MDHHYLVRLGFIITNTLRMAGGIKTNKILRKIHFVASIFILVFVLLYAVTGFVMVKYEWFAQGSYVSKVVKTIPLASRPDTADLAGLGHQLKEAYHLSGRLKTFKSKDNKIHCCYQHPGTYCEAILNATLDSITISQSERMSVGGLAAELHRVRRNEGGFIYTIWFILYDLSALAFIIFALTGIALWFIHRKSLKAGWVVLIPVVVFVIIIIFILL